MSAKTSADVLIGGKIYTLSGYESEDYLQKVANYINNKINEFDEMEQFRRFPGEMKSTLVELNIADDYFKAREQAEKLDQDVREKEKEIYELKHELISLRITAESSEKTTAELEKENRKLLLNKAKLESALEDALLGKVKGQVMPEQKQPAEETEKQQPAAEGSKQKQPETGKQKQSEAGKQKQMQGNIHKDRKKHQGGNETGNQNGKAPDAPKEKEDMENENHSV